MSETLLASPKATMSPWASTIYQQRYAKPGETWEDYGPGSKSTPRRVVEHVMGPYFPELVEEMIGYIADRKFMPGGRYLYATGERFHQTQNCFSGETEIVTRDGTKSLVDLVGTEPTIMTSRGEWVKAEVHSFGVQPLLKVRLRRQGKDKIIYATAGHSWRVARDWNATVDRPANKQEVVTADLCEGMRLWDVFGHGISRTPVSPQGVQHGIVFGDGNVPKDEHGFNTSNVRLCGEKDAQLLKYFPLSSTRAVEDDIEVRGLPRRYKEAPSLHDDRSYLLGWLAGYFAADGNVSASGKVVLSSVALENLEFARDVCYLLGIGTYGILSQDRISNLTGRPSRIYNLTFMKHTLTEAFFLITSHRERFLASPVQRRAYWNVVSVEATDRVEEVFCAVVPDTHEFVLADNILTGNCLLLKVEDSRESISKLMERVSSALMTGAGIGIVWSALRGEGVPIRGMGGTSTGPLAFMQSINEIGRHIMQGGSRRSAIWAGLHWWHPDVFKFIHLKDWSEDIMAMKAKDYNTAAPMDTTNISVILDDDFFAAYEDPQHPMHEHAELVYWEVIEQMLKTGEPGFSVDVGENAGESLRNACTEITSSDDNDICNLGSINMAQVDNITEFARIVEVGTAFLLCGTLYSLVPYKEVDDTRTKNRRLGLGLMGIYEWLVTRGKPYGPDDELASWLDYYAESTLIAAEYADRLGISRPIKTRGIAPNGTISIVAETTSSIEPLFAVAMKRRYLKGKDWHFQYVIDATAQRLIDKGIDPAKLETAYDLAKTPERRVAFQAWLQEWVDHGISSTLNLPAYGSHEFTNEEFGTMLFKYLPKLRGVTVYPDGARGGQPLNVVPYDEAKDWVGYEYSEFGSEQACVSGSCGI